MMLMQEVKHSYRLEKFLQFFFGMKFFLPASPGRACENIISKTFVKQEISFR